MNKCDKCGDKLKKQEIFEDGEHMFCSVCYQWITEQIYKKIIDDGMDDV